LALVQIGALEWRSRLAEEYRRIELITGATRRRHWSTQQKLRIVAESFEPGETVSSVARRNGVAPNLLFRWRRLMNEGGHCHIKQVEAILGRNLTDPSH